MRKNSKPAIQEGKGQSWKSSIDLDNESLINQQRLWKSPAEKENAEQSIGDGCKEEEEDLEEVEEEDVEEEAMEEEGEDEQR